MIGQILGNRYQLLEKIGGGGMALVYKAKCNLLNRFVAIKILRKEFIEDDEFVKRFKIEAQSAASLSHHNIVSIHDVGVEGDINYIVMEYIDGITLKDYLIKNGALDWRDAVSIFIQISAALESAHKHNIIHRDIKPHNILYTKENIAKVTDFGIARANSESGITKVENTIGSVHYISPEQAKGGYVDEKSDIYSLGVVMYELVTGRLPFEGEAPVTIALKHLQEDPELPININKNIPQGLNNIIMNAISKEQLNRYKNVTQLITHLNEVLEDPKGEFEIEKYDDNSKTKRIPIINNSKVGNNSMGNKKTNKKIKKKMSLALTIFTIIVVLPVFAYVTYKFTQPFFAKSSSEFIVGNYTGRYFYDVESQLKQYGIKVDVVRKNDEKVPRDYILSQEREEGEIIYLNGYNANIEFIVSDGPLRIGINNYEGLDYREVESELTLLNVDFEIKEENSDNIPIEMVTRTDPSSGTEIKPGQKVIVYKSIGPEEKLTLVPYLIGKSRVEALNIISNSNLSIGKVFPEDTSNIIDRIIKQEPKEYEMIEEGSTIDIYFDELELADKRKLVTKFIGIGKGNYSRRIKFTVEIIPSDTKKTEIIFDEIRNSDSFPLNVSIPVPVGGESEVKVYVNTRLIDQFTESLK